MKKLIILTESRRKYEVMCGSFFPTGNGRCIECHCDKGNIIASFSNVASAYWEESAKEVED